ncbi:hypothetical protein Taro_012711, partial [Colocasia esculenta]|nr:hypothetical protein [Colocasia esculenta]
MTDMTSSNNSLMCYYDGVLRIEDHKSQYEGGIVCILHVKKDTIFTELMRKLYILTKYDERHIKIGITCKWHTSIGEYIVVRVEDDETVESMFDLYHSRVSTIQLYLEKKNVDNISIQGNNEVQTHGHIDDNLHIQHYEYQQPSGFFTRLLNDDVDSTRFYSANERDVRYESYDYTLPTDYNPSSIGYGDGSSQHPFMPITDLLHTFHSTSSSGLINRHMGLLFILSWTVDIDIRIEVLHCNLYFVAGLAEMDQIPGPVDNSLLYAQEGHRSQLVYSGQEQEVLKCWEHHKSFGGWPVEPRIM